MQEKEENIQHLFLNIRYLEWSGIYVTSESVSHIFA